jgi:DNA-binding SARP family transcriptional activator
MAVAHLTLFGRFDIRLADGRVLDLPGQKDRALLAILALSRGAALSRDKLTGLLWGDRGDAQARDSLKHALKHIRQLLSDAVTDESGEGIVADRNEVRLAPDCINVDVIAFEDLIRRGTSEALEQASRLCAGEFLEDISVRDSGSNPGF